MAKNTIMWIKNNYKLVVIFMIPIIIGFGVFCVTGILTKSWFDAQTNRAIITSAQLGALAWGILWIAIPSLIIVKIYGKLKRYQ